MKIVSAGDNTFFTITDAKLYVRIVTLSAEDNAKLSKLLSDGFKRSVYWNKYRVTANKIVDIAANNEEKFIRELLDSSYEGVKILFVLAYNNTEGNNEVSINSFRKWFLPRVKIKNYNIKFNGRNFYDQLINDLMKQQNEVRNKSTGQGDDYTAGCLLDFTYFEKNYRLIAADLSKQKLLYADPKAIQQINFTGKIKAAANNTRVIIYYILEQSRKTKLEFAKETTKVL